MNVLVQQSGAQQWQQWLIILLTVLQVLVGYFQWQHPQDLPVSESDADTIAERVAEELHRYPQKPSEPDASASR